MKGWLCASEYYWQYFIFYWARMSVFMVYFHIPWLFHAFDMISLTSPSLEISQSNFTPSPGFPWLHEPWLNLDIFSEPNYVLIKLPNVRYFFKSLTLLKNICLNVSSPSACWSLLPAWLRNQLSASSQQSESLARQAHNVSTWSRLNPANIHTLLSIKWCMPTKQETSCTGLFWDIDRHLKLTWR